MSADFLFAVIDKKEVEFIAQNLDRLAEKIAEDIGFDMHGEPWTLEELEGRVTAALAHLEDGEYDWATFRDFDSDRTWIVSGGMSWGDAPTEACDHIWLLSNIYDMMLTEHHERG